MIRHISALPCSLAESGPSAVTFSSTARHRARPPAAPSAGCGASLCRTSALAAPSISTSSRNDRKWSWLTAAKFGATSMPVSVSFTAEGSAMWRAATPLTMSMPVAPASTRMIPASLSTQSMM